ncbi:MAG: hypothetical protein JW748_07950 [Anaerolineales bacterium]|nr:hypothetical protein [Anaerolineales bacterium]
MAPIVQIILLAGAVFTVFLLMAALAWGIRTRRNEEDFMPAPNSLQKHNRRMPAAFPGDESAPDWMRQPGQDAGGSGQPERIPAGIGGQPFFTDFLRNAVPQISTLIDLSRAVKQMQAAGDWTDASEDRKAAIRKALDQMLEQQPQNEFLIQMRDSLEFDGESDAEAEDEEGMQVIQVAGRNIIRVDGTEYYSLAEIPDPRLRNQARQMLLDMNDKESS